MNALFLLRASVILALVPVLTASRLPTIQTYVTGHLLRDGQDPVRKVGGFVVLVKEQGTILASAKTDRRGNFKLTFTPTVGPTWDFYAVAGKGDTVLLSSVEQFESDTPDLSFTLPYRNGER